MPNAYSFDEVLSFWFPENGHWEDLDLHFEFWETRMQGGMDAAIRRDFAALTEAAARSELDHWAETPRGRLALIIALDQFSRSLWAGTPAAFAQDCKAARLALAGLENGHYEALPHTWERQFYIIAISHCEGPDHIERMERCLRLSKELAAIALPHLTPIMPISVEQSERVRDVIRRFGRHPHRNAVYGRPSSAAEEAYIAAGHFPHQRDLEADRSRIRAGE